MNYSIEARPYGVMLGCAAMAMLCWQTAARRTSGRTLALVGLAVSLALAVNMQYYAVLLFVPICAAEAVRMVEFRRVDGRMLAAIGGGLAGLILLVPFAKALLIFQKNHRHIGVADAHFVTHSYLWLAIGYAKLSLEWQHVIGLCCFLVVLGLVSGLVRARKRIRLRLPLAEAVLLILLTAIPVFAFFLAIFVTHFIEARYILPALIGVCAVIGILLTPLFQDRMTGAIVLVLLFAAIALAGIERIRSDRESAQAYMASLSIRPEVQRAMGTYAGQPIYVINHFVYEFVHYYSPSDEMRSRLVLVYQDPQICQWKGVGGDVNEQMANMEADGVPLVVSYESLAKPETEHLFLLYHAPWDWTDGRLSAAHAEIKPLGEFFGGELVSVRFP